MFSAVTHRALLGRGRAPRLLCQEIAACKDDYSRYQCRAVPPKWAVQMRFLSFAGFSGSALPSLNVTLYRYVEPLAALSLVLLALSPCPS